MRLRFTAEALSHLGSIFSFLSERNQSAARRFAADIRAASERLREFPRMGRVGTAAGTHEWGVRGSPYLMVYEIDESRNEVRILAVFHGAQNWQDQSR